MSILSPSTWLYTHDYSELCEGDGEVDIEVDVEVDDSQCMALSTAFSQSAYRASLSVKGNRFVV